MQCTPNMALRVMQQLLRGEVAWKVLNDGTLGGIERVPRQLYSQAAKTAIAVLIGRDVPNRILASDLFESAPDVLSHVPFCGIEEKASSCLFDPLAQSHGTAK